MQIKCYCKICSRKSGRRNKTTWNGGMRRAAKRAITLGVELNVKQILRSQRRNQQDKPCNTLKGDRADWTATIGY